MGQEELELTSDDEEKSIHGMTVEKVKELILSSFSSEEVKEIHDCIVESYHFDVFDRI